MSDRHRNRSKGLRRQVQQLRKRARELEEALESQRAEEQPRSAIKPPPPAPKCPDCREPLAIIPIGDFTIHSCSACGYRRRTGPG